MGSERAMIAALLGSFIVSIVLSLWDFKINVFTMYPPLYVYPVVYGLIVGATILVLGSYISKPPPIDIISRHFLHLSTNSLSREKSEVTYGAEGN